MIRNTAGKQACFGSKARKKHLPRFDDDGLEPGGDVSDLDRNGVRKELRETWNRGVLRGATKMYQGKKQQE